MKRQLVYLPYKASRRGRQRYSLLAGIKSGSFMLLGAYYFFRRSSISYDTTVGRMNCQLCCQQSVH
jgi:hypothetical protein